MDLFPPGHGVSVHASRLHPLLLASCWSLAPWNRLSILLCFLLSDSTRPGIAEDLFVSGDMFKKPSPVFTIEICAAGIKC